MRGRCPGPGKPSGSGTAQQPTTTSQAVAARSQTPTGSPPRPGRPTVRVTAHSTTTAALPTRPAGSSLGGPARRTRSPRPAGPAPRPGRSRRRADPRGEPAGPPHAPRRPRRWPPPRRDHGMAPVPAWSAGGRVRTGARSAGVRVVRGAGPPDRGGCPARAAVRRASTRARCEGPGGCASPRGARNQAPPTRSAQCPVDQTAVQPVRRRRGTGATGRSRQQFPRRGIAATEWRMPRRTPGPVVPPDQNSADARSRRALSTRGSSLPTTENSSMRCSRARSRSSPESAGRAPPAGEGVVDVPAEQVDVRDQGLRVDVVGLLGRRRPGDGGVDGGGALHQLGAVEPERGLGVGGVGVDEPLVLRHRGVEVALDQGVLGGGVTRVAVSSASGSPRPAPSANGWCRPVMPCAVICSSTWPMIVRSSSSGGSWSSGASRPWSTIATSGTDCTCMACAIPGWASTSTRPTAIRPSSSSATSAGRRRAGR